MHGRRNSGTIRRTRQFESAAEALSVAVQCAARWSLVRHRPPPVQGRGQSLRGYIDGGAHRTGSTPGPSRLLTVLRSRNTKHGVPIRGE